MAGKPAVAYPSLAGRLAFPLPTREG